MYVVQVNERYASPVIAGRYQICASAVGTSYYIADLSAKDMTVNAGSEIRRFPTIREADEYIQFTLLGLPRIDLSLFNINTQEDALPKALETAPILARGVRPPIPKPPIATGFGRVAPVKPPTKGTPGRKMSTHGSLASLIRDLIREGRKSDLQILDAVRAAFPEKKVFQSAITYYRERMK